MSSVDLFAIGNALIDQEFKVSDEFLTQHNLQKGTMQLTDGDQQANLYDQLQQSEVYKGQASGGSAANTTVAFSALGGTAFYGCRVLFSSLGKRSARAARSSRSVTLRNSPIAGLAARHASRSRRSQSCGAV